jgi:hypothetical protein
MPISHGTETLRTFSPRIQLELKDNPVSVVVDGRAVAKVTVGDNDYQVLLAAVRQSR